MLDAQGRIVPTADNLVTFRVEGPGCVAGVGNGNPGDHDPDKAGFRHAFNGKCMVLVGATDKTGGKRTDSDGVRAEGGGAAFERGGGEGIGFWGLGNRWRRVIDRRYSKCSVGVARRLPAAGSTPQGEGGARRSLEKVAEAGEEIVFFLPGRVHETVHQGNILGGLQPGLDPAQIIRVVVTARQGVETVVGEEMEVLGTRFSPQTTMVTSLGTCSQEPVNSPSTR